MDTTPTRLGNRLLAALPEEDHARLFPYLSPQSLSKGHVLQRREQPLRSVFFPDQSLIWLLNPTEDGANAQVAVVGAEGLVGIEAVLGSRVAMCDAVVHIPGGTAGVAMSVDIFRRELDRRGAMYDLAQQYAANLVRALTLWVACNALHSAEERCCRWLLEVEARAGRSELPVTHELLSDLLGLRRSTVTLIMGRLQESGIVSAARGSVRIDDRPALEARACDCHRLLTALLGDPSSGAEAASSSASHPVLLTGA